MAIELNEEDVEYNVEDIVCTLNGVKLNGIVLKDNCISIGYDSPRYSIYEFINNAIIGVHTNSIKGHIKIDTYALSKLNRAFCATSLTKSSFVLVISIKNKMTYTLSSAGIESYGEDVYGASPAEKSINIIGRLGIVPIGI